jgi:Protein of unknown function (DUF2511).
MKNIFYLLFTMTCLFSCSNDNVLGEKTISKEEFGNKWPFTVSKGTLKLVQYEAENVNPEIIRGVIFEVDGKIYGINGTAKSWGKKLGYSDVNEIWADDTVEINKLVNAGVPRSNAGMKIEIGFVIDMGLKLANKAD